MPQGLIRPSLELVWSQKGRNDSTRNRNSPQWDPIWPFGACGPAPVNRSIMALIRRAKSAFKMVLYFTHRNGPIWGVLWMQDWNVANNRISRRQHWWMIFTLLWLLNKFSTYKALSSLKRTFRYKRALPYLAIDSSTSIEWTSLMSTVSRDDIDVWYESPTRIKNT